MLSDSERRNYTLDDKYEANVSKISTCRRYLPQVIAAVIKNLFSVYKGLSESFSAIVIPALLGISNALNPDETIRIAPVEASWLSSLAFIGHPFGSVLSGFISDAIGRRRAMMVATIPAITGFVLLVFANSFTIVCIGMTLLSFAGGLKDAPIVVYLSETSEPAIRGSLLTLGPITTSIGIFVIHLLGSFLSWRQVACACAAFCVSVVIFLYFIPETPNWLLLKDRPKDARKSLQWLRGWVSSDAVQDEFTKIQKHSIFSSACVSCAKQSIRCHHRKTILYDKMRELKRKRSLKPLALVLGLNFFMELCLVVVWRPYIIQIVKAFGMPLDANLTSTILSSINIAANFVTLLSIHSVGKRKLYLSSSSVVVFLSLALSIYGFVFFPSNWTSFKDPSNPSIPNFDLIRDIVGDYGYLALIFLFLIQFCTGLGFTTVPMMIQAEVLSLKLRSFVLGVTIGLRSVLSSIVKKSYYDIEMWLTPAGATLFYGIFNFVGLISMYFILLETENISLEDIELHYADNAKGITDIKISSSV